jgi:hypothetical protein
MVAMTSRQERFARDRSVKALAARDRGHRIAGGTER